MQVMFSSYLSVIALLSVVTAEPLVNTTIGIVRGTTELFDGVAVNVYKGIRYAEAPIGQLRFSQPRPYRYRDGIYNATEFGPACPQYNTAIDKRHLGNTGVDEDCLMLNVYVPVTANQNNTMATVVCIEGDQFVLEQIEPYDGTPLSAVGQVIVITINYRLGALGFLSSGDGVAMGNYALRDQQLALHWVQDNIGHFNGDPNRVTLSGGYTGGLCVLHHMLSPASDGLFHRVILQDAVFWEPAEARQAGHHTQTLASLLNCSSSMEDRNSKNIVDCLRDVPVEMLMKAQSQLQWSNALSPPFIVAIDGDIVTGSLRSLMDHGNLNKYDVMIGITDQNDGAYSVLSQIMSAHSMNINMSTGMSADMFKTFVEVVASSYAANHQTVSEAIEFKYTDWQNTDDDRIRLVRATDIIDDREFKVRAVELVYHCTKNSLSKSAYFYEMISSAVRSTDDGIDNAAGHGDELVYLIKGVNSTGSQVPTEHVTLNRDVMTYWSNFAKSGDPNSPGSIDGLINWPQFTTENQQYLHIDSNPSVKVKPNAEMVAFWSNYVLNFGATENACPASVVPPILMENTFVEVETGPTVDITYGKVSGLTVKSHDSLGGKNVDVFLGIPYAKPPIGSRRFQAPESPNTWSGQLSVTRYRPACLQVGKPNSSEDCLYLNVFSSHRHFTNHDLLPVMFIVEGDNLATGDASHFSGDAIAAFGNMVVVTFNYRLSVLGFLSTENDILSGNYGLQDILLALEWIRGDIENFGGNPDRVTIAGFSSGAWAVQYLMTSSRSRDLFHRAICLSGSSFSPLTDSEYRKTTARQGAEDFIRKVNCERRDNSETLQCLRQLSVDEIRNSGMTTANDFTPVVVVDGRVISHDPAEIMLAGDYDPVEMILGTTNGELAQTVLKKEINSRSDFLDAVRTILETYLFANEDLILLAIQREYINTMDEDSGELTKRLLDLTNDFMIYAPMMKTANIHTSTGGKVYMYHFNQRPSYSTLPEGMGALQGDDVRLVLGEPFQALNRPQTFSFNNEERHLSMVMMKYISQFVKTGNPNVAHTEQSTEWPQFTFSEKKYLELDICPDVKVNLKHQGVSFWNDFVPHLEQIAAAIEDSEDDNAIGMGLGLNMTQEEVETLVQALVGLVIALVVLFIAVVFVLIIYAYNLANRQIASELEDRNARTNGFYNGFVMNLNEDDYFTRL
ncbi:uncharacterized protein [Ptychodera flava]|uniref:uncharacterized protein n=1 Tax=Ptychodera flava TaxID=63121 RepID=UPI00396A852D